MEDEYSISAKTAIIESFDSMSLRPTGAPSSRKPKVEAVKELSDEDWEFLKANFPELSLRMMRLRFRCKFVPVSWFKDNCCGLYYRSTSDVVMFELDDDAVLFKMAFQG